MQSHDAENRKSGHIGFLARFKNEAKLKDEMMFMFDFIRMLVGISILVYSLTGWLIITSRLFSGLPLPVAEMAIMLVLLAVFLPGLIRLAMAVIRAKWNQTIFQTRYLVPTRTWRVYWSLIVIGVVVSALTRINELFNHNIG